MFTFSLSKVGHHIWPKIKKHNIAGMVEQLLRTCLWNPHSELRKKRLQKKFFRLAEAGFSDFATQTKQLFLALSPTLEPKNNMLRR